MFCLLGRLLGDSAAAAARRARRASLHLPRGPRDLCHTAHAPVVQLVTVARERRPLDSRRAIRAIVLRNGALPACSTPASPRGPTAIALPHAAASQSRPKLSWSAWPTLKRGGRCYLGPSLSVAGEGGHVKAPPPLHADRARTWPAVRRCPGRCLKGEWAHTGRGRGPLCVRRWVTRYVGCFLWTIRRLYVLARRAPPVAPTVAHASSCQGRGLGRGRRRPAWWLAGGRSTVPATVTSRLRLPRRSSCTPRLYAQIERFVRGRVSNHERARRGSLRRGSRQ